MTYSLQLYTVRAAFDHDLMGTMRRIAGIGYQTVEPYNFSAHPDQLLEGLTSNGLLAPSGHAPLLDSDQTEIFRAADKLGIKTVIAPYVSPSRWIDLEGIKLTAAALNAAAHQGADYDITVGYHNHEFELEARIGGRTSLEILCDFLDPSVVLELDVYWAAVGGEDPVKLLDRLGDRVRLLHIKDGPITKEVKDQVAVGSGMMPVREILNAATSLDVAVVELDDFDGDIFTALEDSWAYLTEAPA